MSKKDSTPKGEALLLKEHVAYSDHSVVSKTLVDHKAGTVTIFAFDAGQGLSEHTAPFDAIVQILDGEAEISVGGKAQTVTEGQMIILPANVPHALKGNVKFKMMLTMIRS